MKRRIVSFIVCALMLTALLPATALADGPGGIAELELSVGLNLNKQLELDITIPQNSQLSINGIGTKLELTESGKPLVNSGTLIAVANAETFADATRQSKKAFLVENKAIVFSGEGGSDAVKLDSGDSSTWPSDLFLASGEDFGEELQPTQKQQELLDAINSKYGANAPALSFGSFIARLKELYSECVDSRSGAFDEAAFEQKLVNNFNISREELQQAWDGVDVIVWLGQQLETEQADKARLAERLLPMNGDGVAKLNGKSFTLELDGKPTLTMKTKASTRPSFQDSNYARIPLNSGGDVATNPTVLVITGEYGVGSQPAADQFKQSEVGADGAVTSSIPSAVSGVDNVNALQKVTVVVHTTTGEHAVIGILYQNAAGYGVSGTPNADNTQWTIVWDNTTAEASNLRDGFTSIKLYIDPTYDDDVIASEPDYTITNTPLSESSNTLSPSALTEGAPLMTGAPVTAAAEAEDTTTAAAQSATDSNGADTTTTTMTTTTTTDAATESAVTDTAPTQTDLEAADVPAADAA